MPNPIYAYILNLSTDFVDKIIKRTRVLFCTQLNGFKSCDITITIYRQSFVFTVCSICSIGRTLSGTITPGQSESGSNGNEGVLHIPQISKARASLSAGLISYPVYSLGDGVLPHYRHAVDVFYSPSRLGCEMALS